MNGRRRRKNVFVILIIIGLSMSIVPGLKYLGLMESFTVVAKPGNRAALPIAVAVSEWTFAAITVSVVATLGWFCFRWLKRGRNHGDS